MVSDTDALQRIYRLVDILDRDIAREIGSADARRYNETDFSALEFLIELKRTNDFASWKILRQTCRQLKSLQKVDDCVTLTRRQSSSFN